MAVTKVPDAFYSRPEWLKGPRKPKDGEEYEKYDYETGESLKSIAEYASKPWHTITWQDLTDYNWGTSTPAEVNWYLRGHCGCKLETDDGNNYRFSSDDERSFVWIPKPEKMPSGEHRSPSNIDVGHVALSDHEKKHSNTLVIRPKYAISLQLGDVDALFEPMAQNKPWESKGVQYRLQALGYLYRSFDYSQAKINIAAEKVWDYYKMVHDRNYGAMTIYNDRNYGALTIHNVAVASQTQATVKFTGANIVLKVTGGANAGTTTLNYTSPRNTLGGLATAINALGKGWVASADKVAPLSSHLTASPETYAQGTAYRQISKAVRKNQTAATVQVTDTNIILKITGGANAGTQTLDFNRDRAKLVGLTQAIKALNKGWVAKVHRNPDARSSDLVAVPATDAQGAENHLTCKAFRLSDAEVLTVLKKETRNSIVGVLRGKDLLKKGEFLKGSLPTKGKTGMIRVPGSYCFKVSWSTFLPDDDEASKAQEWTGNRRPLEDKLLEKNELVGKIPLVATVHRVEADGSRKPAEGVAVYFQLIDPDALDTADPLCPPKLNDKQLNRLEDKVDDNLGPGKFVDEKLAAAKATYTDAEDPQRENCPKDYKGKGGHPVDGHIFEVIDRPGLHTRRSDKHEDYGKLTAAKKAKENAAGAHKYAVVARTNEKGKAGVIFMPSTMGGDRYKIRAYVGPDTLEFDGKDEKGPVAETGTLVVWRNMRLHRYLQWPKSTLAEAKSSPDLVNMFSHSSFAGWGDTVERAYNLCDLNTPLQNIDFTTLGTGRTAMPKLTPKANYKYVNPGPNPTDGPAKEVAGTLTQADVNEGWRPVDIVFTTLREQLRRSYCEFISDTDQLPERLTSEELAQAIKKGNEKLASNDAPANIDWDALVFHDPKSPWLVNVRHPNEYIKRKGSGKDNLPGNFADVTNAIMGWGVERMTEYFAGGGLYPGLTIIQAGRGDTLKALKNTEIFTSGLAQASRGGYVFYTKGIYDTFLYSIECQANHEISHCYVRHHQSPPTGSCDDLAHQDKGECTCCMSYRACLGDFCGRCVMAFRGWQTKNKDLAGV